MNQEEQKQSLEKSTKYIAGYLKFELKKDLNEVLSTICTRLEAIVSSINAIGERLGGRA